MLMESKSLHDIPSLFHDLAIIISGDIDCSDETLSIYSTDGSPYKIKPRAIIYPKNTIDIKHTIALANEYSMSITVHGKGMSYSGGSINDGIIIDLTKYFNQIGQIDPLKQTITVSAGTSIHSIQEKLTGVNMYSPLLSEQDKNATIGGIISTKNINPSSFIHGESCDWIESITVVLNTGEENHITEDLSPSGRLLGVYKEVSSILKEKEEVIKNTKKEYHSVSGYNIWSNSTGSKQLINMLAGGEGTLGIITSVTLRLIPHKKHTKTIYIPINDSKILISCIETAKHHKAEHIFLFDETFKKLTDKYHPHLLPKSTDSQYTLCVTYRDNDIEKLHDTYKNFIKALPIKESLPSEQNETDYINRITDKSFLFSLIDSYTKGVYTPITFADGIIVPIKYYNEILNEIESYLSSLGKIYIITGNAGSGHISIITMFDSKLSNYEIALEEYAQTIFSYVKKYDGSISAINGEGLNKTPYLPIIYNEEIIDIFKKIKTAWDPNSIFNPNKKISTPKHFLHNHLIH